VSFNIQPAEIVKVTVIMYLWYLNEYFVYPVSALKNGLLPRLVVIVFSFGLVMLQPDRGTGCNIIGGGVCTLLFQGAKIKHFPVCFQSVYQVWLV
jgi:cell division protein FtsW